LLVRFVRPRSAFGLAMFSITFVILCSAIFFGEGVVCVLMAAPLLYFIGALLGLGIDFVRRRTGSRGGTSFVLIPFVLMSFEGVHEKLSLSRDNVVTVESVIVADAASVRQKLSEPPYIGEDLPAFFRIGFPLPAATTGRGLEIGTRKTVRFEGGEGNPGDLTAVITGGGDGWTECEFVSDTSHISHWMTWQRARVDWEPVDDRHVRVRWSVTYRRMLDPAWYFGPLERFGVRLALEHLVHSLEDSSKASGRGI
jgi:hypothetical protein